MMQVFLTSIARQITEEEEEEKAVCLTQLSVFNGLERHPNVFIAGRDVAHVQHLIGQFLSTHGGRNLFRSNGKNPNVISGNESIKQRSHPEQWAVGADRWMIGAAEGGTLRVMQQSGIFISR